MGTAKLLSDSKFYRKCCCSVTEHSIEHAKVSVYAGFQAFFLLCSVFYKKIYTTDFFAFFSTRVNRFFLCGFLLAKVLWQPQKSPFLERCDKTIPKTRIFPHFFNVRNRVPCQNNNVKHRINTHSCQNNNQNTGYVKVVYYFVPKAPLRNPNDPRTVFLQMCTVFAGTTFFLIRRIALTYPSTN